MEQSFTNGDVICSLVMIVVSLLSLLFFAWGLFGIPLAIYFNSKKKKTDKEKEKNKLGKMVYISLAGFPLLIGLKYFTYPLVAIVLNVGLGLQCYAQ